MATCKHCKQSVIPKVVEALSFECACGHRWIAPQKDKPTSRLNISMKEENKNAIPK